MNRSIVFFLLAGLAATLAALIVYSSLKKKDEEFRRVLAQTVPIVVAAHDIAVGAKLDAGAIKLARWPRNSLPPAAITDLNSVIGSVARAEFVENEPIVATRLVSGDKAAGVLPLMIPSDMRAMSVAVDEVADMAGFVLPDTRVDVLLSLPGTDAEAGSFQDHPGEHSGSGGRADTGAKGQSAASAGRYPAGQPRGSGALGGGQYPGQIASGAAWLRRQCRGFDRRQRRSQGDERL